jgi:hypothetical protein
VWTQLRASERLACVMKQARLFCLALTMAAASFVAIAARAAPADDTLPKPIWFGQLAFSIPFNVQSSLPSEQQPSQVQLYVTTDRGNSWRLAQTVSGQAKNFDFRAQTEGEFGFLIRTVDRQGRVIPSPAAGPPELIVVVDTTAPKLEISAVRAPSGEVRVNWKATDPLLNVDSLKIEYQVSAGNWRSVAVDRQQNMSEEGGSAGVVNLWPADAPPPPSAIQIRAEILDRAGNPTRSQAKTHIASAEEFPAKPDGDLTTSNSRGPWPESTTRWQPERSSSGPLDRNVTARTPEPNRGPNNDPPYMERNPRWPTREAGSNSFHNDPNRAIVSQINPPIRNQTPITDESRDERRNKRNSQVSDIPPKNTSPAPPRTDGQPRLVNSKSFEMDYEIQSVGPSGISKVELWGTRDAGRTWTSYGTDNDNRSPMRVKVEGEGLYGFRISVQSGSGLASALPRSGDQPEVLIAVDLTKPNVRLTDVQNGKGEHVGEVLIRWEASDAGLTHHPVTLQYADNSAGPWSVIAANLESSGDYIWQPSEDAPDRVYLRLEARDEAGNIGVYESAQPVPLDRIRPEGRIRGVRPINDSATRVQTYEFNRR